MSQALEAKWYKCLACGNLSRHQLECCGQLMEGDNDENEELPEEFRILTEFPKATFKDKAT